MELKDSVASLMNPRVISVLANTPILAAIDIVLSNNYNGVPVVDRTGALVGILTKYDLIINRASIRDDMKVGDLMNNDPLVLTENMTVEDAVAAFTEHHKVDPIPVVDMDKKVIGVISRYDVVKLFRQYGMNFNNAQTSSADQRPWALIFLIIIGGSVGALYYLGYLSKWIELLF